MKTFKKVAMVVALTSSIVYLAGCASEKPQAQPSTSGQQQEKESAVKEVSKEVKAPKDVNIDIGKWGEGKLDEGMEAPDGEKFITVTYTIHNPTSESYHVNPFSFTLEDSSGSSISPASVDLEGQIQPGSLAAGKSLTGVIGYFVPKDYKGGEVDFQKDETTDKVKAGTLS